MTSVIFYVRRLTARAMIRSRVSSFAGNCLTRGRVPTGGGGKLR